MSDKLIQLYTKALPILEKARHPKVYKVKPSPSASCDILFEDGLYPMTVEDYDFLCDQSGAAAEAVIELARWTRTDEDGRPRRLSGSRYRRLRAPIVVALKILRGPNGAGRKSKEEEIGLIAAQLRQNPNATSKEVSVATGIDASDIRRLWAPLKRANKAGKTGAVASETHCSICDTVPVGVTGFACSECGVRISDECKMCHFTQHHPDKAIP